MEELSVTNVSALTLAVASLVWIGKVAFPAVMKDRADAAAAAAKERAETMAAFTRALEAAREETAQSREYHRSDKEEMRVFMSRELAEQRKAIAGLARAVDRLTVAQVAAAQGADVADALARYTNGDVDEIERAISARERREAR